MPGVPRRSSWSQALDLVPREHTVGGQHRHPLDHRLRDDHAVERVTVVARKRADAKRVSRGDGQGIGLRRLQARRNEVERRQRERYFAEMVLYGDLPAARYRTWQHRY